MITWTIMKKMQHNEHCQTESQYFCREKSELWGTEIEIYTVELYPLHNDQNQ